MMPGKVVFSSTDDKINLVDTTHEPTTYPVRWAKALGVWQIALGLAVLGCNIATTSDYAENEYGLWCGIIFILAGIFQIISGRTNMKCWIGVCFGMCVLAAAFGFPVIVYSAKSIQDEGRYRKWSRIRMGSEGKYMVLFGCMGLIGVVEMGVAVASALMACKALSCPCSCTCKLSTKMSELLKRFVDKEKNNPLRAVRLGKTQICLGLLAIMFNATGIALVAHKASTGHGIWCGVVFILAGCFLFMSGKSRIWILVCFPFTVLAAMMSLPILVLGTRGLFKDITHRADNYDYDYYGRYNGIYGDNPEQGRRAGQIAMNAVIIVVALVELVIAIVSAVQIGKCFGCDGKSQADSAPKELLAEPLYGDQTADEAPKDAGLVAFPDPEKQALE